ncbi:uncharacterized protein MEPE_02902 [Melanopsichium pennsylvanicum]|uniref:Uncharacterized protein n=1 Tax=Melanopsichium pennsylvanicum TaxID=63383 RepID=A0AAJ5C558_9BASI|nr:uncharacterized protein MEPE_02902 [Melanopsichium pennsylvanicum]
MIRIVGDHPNRSMKAVNSCEMTIWKISPILLCRDPQHVWKFGAHEKAGRSVHGLQAARRQEVGRSRYETPMKKNAEENLYVHLGEGHTGKRLLFSSSSTQSPSRAVF